MGLFASKWRLTCGAGVVILISASTACSLLRTHSSKDLLAALPGETHFKNIRQLTFDGINVKAYWSFNGRYLTYQHKDLGAEASKCDQIYRMDADGSAQQILSSGEGQNTCSFFFPDDSRVLFSSTARPGLPASCPKDSRTTEKAWPIRDSLQIYSVKPDGTDPLPLEPGAPRAYNAEATVCKDGSVVFTSDRSGDLELFTGKIDPRFGTLSDVKAVTHEEGYDGAASFSPDCRQLVWRASRPKTGRELSEYKRLLARHLYKPTAMEIWIGNADGSNARPLTRLHATSFAPVFTPDAKKIVFASNVHTDPGNKFELYMIGVDGSGLERISYSDSFDGFPMFSPDGKYLAFSSNRNAGKAHETNIFVTEWIDTPSPEQEKR
jgi:Tol biopolymer transport system component